MRIAGTTLPLLVRMGVEMVLADKRVLSRETQPA
jgi:hypothetical protein